MVAQGATLGEVEYSHYGAHTLFKDALTFFSRQRP